MPIEIRELVIKTTVDESEKSQTGEKGRSPAPAGGGGDMKKMKERIINECMNRINDHLRTHNER